MKVKSIDVSDKMRTSFHIHGDSQLVLPVQDITFELEDGRKFLAEMVLIPIDEKESSTTSSSIPTTDACHSEVCECGGLMLSIDKCVTWECERCGIVEKLTEIESRKPG